MERRPGQDSDGGPPTIDANGHAFGQTGGT